MMTSSENTITQFRTQINSLGGHFESARDLVDVREYLVKLVSSSRATRIVLSSNVNATELFPTDQAWPFEIASQSKMPREEFYTALQTATIGVSTADLAVAETGTLIDATSEESDRLVTALPEIHVVFLPRSRLVRSLHDAEPYVSHMLRREDRIVVSLISASSRTTDIGGLLVLGAHGPKELHVLLLDQEPAGGA